MALQEAPKSHLNILMAQKLLRFLKLASDFPNNLALCLKDLELLVLATSVLKLVASSLE